MPKSDGRVMKLHVAVVEHTQGNKSWEERFYSPEGIIWRKEDGTWSADTSQWLESAFKAPLGRIEYKEKP